MILLTLLVVVAEASGTTFLPSTKCGYSLYGRSGSFISPGFSTATGPHNNETCEWRITADSDERIIVSVTNLEIDKSPNCSFGYLEFRDGYWYNSPLLGKYSGVGSLDWMISTGNKMLVSYVNLNSSGRGFIANYEAVCGSTLFVDKMTYINSPNYPNLYPLSKKCIWRVIVPDDQKVVLYFDAFNVESQDRCLYDYVEVRDGSDLNSNLTGVYCNSHTPPTYITSNSTSLLIRFVSDATVQQSGFSAIVMNEYDECTTGDHKCTQDCINTLGSYRCACRPGFDLAPNGRDCIVSQCGGTLLASSGRITTPNYPGLYPTNKTCIWDIVTSHHNKITLTFDHFDIESTNGTGTNHCQKDSLRVLNKDDPLFSTPSNFCSSQAHSSWGVSSDVVSLEGNYCGTVPPSPIISQTHKLQLIFNSDLTIAKTGFALNYTTGLDACSINNGNCRHGCVNIDGNAKCNCSGNLTVQSNDRSCSNGDCKFEVATLNGSISSPNYPSYYPINKNCEYLFVTTPGHRVNVSFIDFQLETNTICRYDNVTLYDGPTTSSTVLGTFCGTILPPPVFSSSNELLITFKSDGSNVLRGFQARYSPTCGGTFTADSVHRYIYSHSNFGHDNYGNNIDCQWIITAPNETFVNVAFVDFALENSGGCYFDYVEVFSNETIYGKYCGSTVPPRFCSVGNNITIRFHSDGSVVNRGFSLVYAISEDS